MPYTHFQTVLGEDDVPFVHALRDVAAHLVDAEVDVPAYPGEGDENDQGQGEGKKLAVCGGVGCQYCHAELSAGWVYGDSMPICLGFFLLSFSCHMKWEIKTGTYNM